MEQSNETYNPDDQPKQLRSMHETRETTPVGRQRVCLGVSQYRQQLPSYTGGRPRNRGVTEEIVTTDSTSERLEIVHNYEISKTVERLVKAHGSVRRLSVAVVLDEVDRRRS